MAAAEALFDQGRLIDEDVVRAPTVVASVRKGNRDSLTAMKLRRHAPPKRKRMLKVKVKEGLGGAEAAAVVPVPSAPSPDFTLVWESDGLAERDLNVPSRTNTNPTGSMLWKKGAGEEFDQRHYFRDEVFAKLDWKPDAKQPHQERAIAKFHLVIKGLNYGVFDLKLSHDTRKNTETYKQGNSMTRVHWGKTIKPHIAKPDLLGRTMSLYRKEGNPPEFVIEVD